MKERERKRERERVRASEGGNYEEVFSRRRKNLKSSARGTEDDNSSQLLYVATPERVEERERVCACVCERERKMLSQENFHQFFACIIIITVFGLFGVLSMNLAISPANLTPPPPPQSCLAEATETKFATGEQCDQIWRFFGLWVTF